MGAGLVLLGIVYLVLGLCFGGICANLARRKRLSGNLWGLLGFFFWIIALAVLIVVPTGHDQDTFVFERPDGDRLEIVRHAPGSWTVRLVSQEDDEVIEYLTPSESAALDAMGYDVSDAVVSEIYMRLADQG